MSHIQGPISDVMTENPKFVNPKTLAWDAMKIMEADVKHPITVLPVLEENKVVGLIKMHDILQAGI